MNINLKDLIIADIQNKNYLNEAKSKDDYIKDIQSEISNYIMDLAKQFKVTGNNTEEILKKLEATPAANEVNEIRTLQSELASNPQLGTFPTNIKVGNADLNTPPAIPVAPEPEKNSGEPPTSEKPSSKPSDSNSVVVNKSDFRYMIDARKMIENLNRNSEATRGQPASEQDHLEYLRTEEPKLHEVFTRITNIYLNKVRPKLRSYNFKDNLKKEYDKLYSDNRTLWRAAKYFIMSDKKFSTNRIWAEIFDQVNYPEEGKGTEEQEPKPNPNQPEPPKPNQPEPPKPNQPEPPKPNQPKPRKKPTKKPSSPKKPRSKKSKTDPNESVLIKKYEIFIRDHVVGGSKFNLPFIISLMKINVNQFLTNSKTNGAIVGLKINPDNSYLFKVKIKNLDQFGVANSISAGASDPEFKKMRDAIGKYSSTHLLEEAIQPMIDPTVAANNILDALANLFGKAYTSNRVEIAYNPDNKTSFNLTKDYLTIFKMQNYKLFGEALKVCNSWKEFIDGAQLNKKTHMQEHPDIANKPIVAVINNINTICKFGIPDEFKTDKPSKVKKI